MEKTEIGIEIEVEIGVEIIQQVTDECTIEIDLIVGLQVEIVGRIREIDTIDMIEIEIEEGMIDMIDQEKEFDTDVEVWITRSSSPLEITAGTLSVASIT